MIQRIINKLDKMSILYLATFLFFITILVYANTLVNGLFFDDEHFIYDNPYVINLSIGDYFTKSLSSESGEVSNYYRPLLFLSFGLQYHLFQNIGFIYHLTSFVFHAFNGILLYFLVLKLFKNKMIALLTSIFFIVHPIQTEAVAYASGFGDPLSFFFMMLSILFSFQKDKRFFFSFVFLLFALLSKEIALITPFLIVLSHITIKNNISKQTVISAVTLAAPYFIVAILYFILRITLLNFNNTLNFYGFENEYSGSLFVRLNTFLNLLPLYFQILLYPKDLFIERDASLNIYKTVTPVSILMVSFFVSCTVICVMYFKRQPILLFSVCWFIIAFGPTSGIIPINGIFYEHFLYFPSVGFFLLVSFLLHFLLTNKNLFVKISASILFVICILSLSVRTIMRNSDWNNPIEFYNQTLEHAKTARVYNNLAMAYSDIKEYEKSIDTYKNGIALSDTYSETHYNLANVYITTGDLKKAEEEYKKSLQINRQFYLSYIKLFTIYKNTDNQKGVKNVIHDVEELSQENKNFLPLLEELKKQK